MWITRTFQEESSLRPMVASGTINVGLPTNRRDDVKRELRDTWSPRYFFSRD